MMYARLDRIAFACLAQYCSACPPEGSRRLGLRAFRTDWRDLDPFAKDGQDQAVSYIYIPVPTSEMDSFVTDWNTGRHNKQKALHVVLRPAFRGTMKALRRGLNYGCLSGIPAGAKLYVLAHGNPSGSLTIGAARGATQTAGPAGAWVGGTAAIQAEGLAPGFQDLRVFACGSSVVPAGHAQAFADRLKTALGLLGYNAIHVTGYGGAAHTAYIRSELWTDDQPHKTVSPQGRAVSRAQDAKVVF
jgi:hypothetical protein